MRWTRLGPGPASDRSPTFPSAAAAVSALLAGVGALVAQQFIFGPVFRAAVCYAPLNDASILVTIGVNISSAVPILAFASARTRPGVVILTVLFALGIAVAAGSVFFFGQSDVPEAAELLIACGRESWQSYLIVGLMIYPVAQGGAGIAASRLNAPWPMRVLLMCGISVVISVLFLIAFSSAQSAVG